MKTLSHVQLLATPWTAAYQAPPSLGFSRQEHWSGLPFPSPMQESEKWKWRLSVVSDSLWIKANWKWSNEMARGNIDILGISELKWTWMGEFNSDDHYIYYCGQEFLRKNGVAIMVNKRVWNAVLGCNLKKDRMISVCPRQTFQNHSNPSLCTSQKRWRSWSWTVLWRPTRPSRANTQKRCPLIIGDWNAKVGSQEIPGVTGKFGLEVQNKQGKG